jgi:NADH-quinone oxidoreductase subunit J
VLLTTFSLIVLEVLVVLSSIGVLLSRDNFYAALFLAIASSLSATAFAVVYGILSFTLIVLIYVGATITITVVLAATYRRPIQHRVEGSWFGLVILLLMASLMALSKYSMAPTAYVSISPSQLVSTVLGNSYLDFLLVTLIVLFSFIMIIATRYLRVTQP